MLTGRQRSEVCDADSGEFDLKAELWTIPRECAKNGVAHLLPLSKEALAIINELSVRDASDKLFPARGMATLVPVASANPRHCLWPPSVE